MNLDNHPIVKNKRNIQRTMTLKEFLTKNGITISDQDRCKLGLRLAQIWDSKRLGDKIKVEEDTYKVTDYPIEYLESKIIINTIMKFFKV